MVTPLLPFIRDDFSLDYTQAGFAVSAFTISYGVSHIPAGWLADRIGSRILLLTGISGVALFGLLVGFSNTFILMIIFLILLGAAGGGYHPASAPLISTSVEPKNRGRALGLHQIGGAGSYFLTPIIAVAIASAVGWRGSFIAISIPTIIFGIVLYVILGRKDYAKKPETKSNGATILNRFPGKLRNLVMG